MIALSQKPQPASTSVRRKARLLVIDADERTHALAMLPDLVSYLRRGDVLVVNDAATLPASLAGRTAAGAPVEARLLRPLASSRFENAASVSSLRWQVALFGAGDWRTPTERRPPPPVVTVGDRLAFDGLDAVVEHVSAHTPRLVELRFLVEPSQLLHAIYAAGKPVQYAYHQRTLALWDHQTLFATVPVALEPPSAAMHLTWRDVLALTSAGVAVVSLTHATGLSSTGDAWIDGHLPFPERYVVPPATAAAVNAAYREGRRVLAVGTGVMRALESAAASDGVVTAGSEVTELKIGPEYDRRVVTGLLTGMHETDSSHVRLVGNLVDETLLGEGYEAAIRNGFFWHEFGDVCLVLGKSLVGPFTTRSAQA